MSIGVVDPAMYSAIVYNILLIIICYIFIIVYQMDYTYIAWANVLAAALRTGSEMAFSLRYDHVYLTLCAPSWEVLEEWGECCEFL